MIITKVTLGYVTQQFDTVTGKYVSQAFTAVDVSYENERGELLSDAMEQEIGEEANFGPFAKEEPYLPYDMKQPQEMVDTAENPVNV